MKPYYQDESCTIYHGDAREIGHREGRVITDPPYGAGFYNSDEAVHPKDLFEVVNARAVAMFGYPELLVKWIIGGGFDFPDEWVTWWPTNGHCFGRPAGLPRETEHIAIWGELLNASHLRRARSEAPFAREQAAERGKDVDTVRLGDVWRDPAPGVGFNRHQRLHPNQKPLSLLQRLVTLCSNPGEVIFDPFMGSGTTLLAAKSLNRKAIGIEIEEKYCAIAAERLAQEVLDLGAAA